MAKLKKKVNKNENRCKKAHTDMNMKVGPTRLEPMYMFVMPDLDPMQQQLNRLENMANHEERCARRRAWRGRA